MDRSKQRILLKISGEALAGSDSFGIASEVLSRIAHSIKVLTEQQIQIGIVVGGGNLFRGQALRDSGMNAVVADQIGMLATMMNGLAIRDALESSGLSVCLLSSIAVSSVLEPYRQRDAVASLEQGKVVVFVGGTGNPFFTTDTAACLRAIEIQADLIIKATKVDGIYSADPLKNPLAVRYDYLTYDQVIQNNLGVMDLTAVCLVKDHHIPLRVTNIMKPDALLRTAQGLEHLRCLDPGTSWFRHWISCHGENTF